MARITRDIKALTKATVGLVIDVASTGITVAAGTATGLREVVASTNKDNIKDIASGLVDVAVGNDIGTARKKVASAIDDGDIINTVFGYALDTIHGKKEYRDAVAVIQAKIDTAEDELDLLMSQIELADLELESTKEIARLNKQAEAAKAKA